MKPTYAVALKTTFHRFMALFSLITLLGSCAVEKNSDKILKNSTPDTVKKTNYGAIKSLGRMKKVDRDGLLFDQYIANGFHLPKKKRDSAAIVNYFIETSYAQLGRREFRQWDVVVIRGLAFQVNVEKRATPERPLFPHQSSVELMGIIFLLLGVYFL